MDLTLPERRGASFCKEGKVENIAYIYTHRHTLSLCSKDREERGETGEDFDL